MDNARTTLRKNCPYLELFWSKFSRIRFEYGEMRSISPYSVQMLENTDMNNSEYDHFLRSARVGHAGETKNTLELSDSLHKTVASLEASQSDNELTKQLVRPAN